MNQARLQPMIELEQKLITPEERLNYIPFPPVAGSSSLGWTDVRAEHFRMTLNHELEFPPMAQHLLILYRRPPEHMSLRTEGLIKISPPEPGSVAIIPAGSTVEGVWRGSSDATHIQVGPQLIARVAAEACDVDPDRVELPVVYNLAHPQLQAAMLALHAELTSGGTGGRLLAESLSNVLAVHLVRQATGNKQAAHRRRGRLPTPKLRAALDYIETHLDSELTLNEVAAVAHLSPYHFARMFKASTGLPPHQYVIGRRVERAKRLLQGDGELPLAQVAARAGFWDQGHFTRHFKRLVGVTPKRFR
jgi:AraC family transcriptional regulator